MDITLLTSLLHASGVTKTMSVVYTFFDRERHPKSGRWILSTRIRKFGNVFANKRKKKSATKNKTSELKRPNESPSVLHAESLIRLLQNYRIVTNLTIGAH